MLTSLSAFIAAHGLKMTATRVKSNPHMVADARWHSMASHYRCTISRKDGSRMIVSFSQGSAFTTEPRLEHVLDSLKLDAGSVQDANGFDEWCGEFGYDTDSRAAMSTYQACKSIHARLLRLLGIEGFESLLYGTERL